MSHIRVIERSLFLCLSVSVVLAGYPSLGTAQPAPPTADGAYRGYLAVQMLENGGYEVIGTHNADRLFVPASILKVVTVAAAVEHLGLGHRWRTRLMSERAISNGVLDGDLVVEPGGDPTWSRTPGSDATYEPLAALARQARAAGLTRVRGDLVVDTSGFPGRRHPTDRSFGDLSYRYGTPTSALAVDDATVTVRVAPGRAVGERASVRAPNDIEVINHTTTVGRAQHGAGTLDFIPVWGTDTLLLRGEYPITEAPFVLSVSDPAPELRAARHLRAALADADVTVEGAVRLESQRNTEASPMTAVAEVRSPPLEDLLQRILTQSHNWYADMLTLTLAREVHGSGRFEDGVSVIAEFATRLRVDTSDASPMTVWLQDGSGLSSSNLVTPATIVRVLAYVREQVWGDSLVQALAGPGEGTLAAWPPVPPLAAKTGTLRHTVALAGFLETGVETPVVFCYFVNHHPARRRVARREIALTLARWKDATR